jgi:hypothetical protein
MLAGLEVPLGAPLGQALALAFKYLTGVRVTLSGKQSSLLCREIYYVHKSVMKQYDANAKFSSLKLLIYELVYLP